jgi:uncharacterized protein (TIGR02646 family)
LIQLARPDEPAQLIKNRTKWTTRWTNSLRDGKKIEWATYRAKLALRDPLLAFCQGKCAFCEGTLNVTSFVEIEHYHAKTVRLESVFDWPNLFPTCSICNRRKADIDHQGRLLKPDLDNPELLLWLDAGTGELQPHPTLDMAQQQRVKETIAAYNLQRGALCSVRIEMVKFVNRWLTRMSGAREISELCREEWHYISHPQTPWKFVIRHVLTLAGSAHLAEIDRQAYLRRV